MSPSPSAPLITVYIKPLLDLPRTLIDSVLETSCLLGIGLILCCFGRWSFALEGSDTWEEKRGHEKEGREERERGREEGERKREREDSKNKVEVLRRNSPHLQVCLT